MRSLCPTMPVKDTSEIDKRYNVRPFVEAPASKSGYETIELDALDFGTLQHGESAAARESRQKLAAKVEKSLLTYGFLSIVNHGIDLEEIEHVKSIAQSLCELSPEEQAPYLAGAWKSDLEDRKVSPGAERGLGFKPKKYWSMKNGVEDSIVFYNFNKMLHEEFFDTEANLYPELARAHLDEIAGYFRKVHLQVLKNLTILCDIVLEKPEGYIWENYYKPIEGDHENSGLGVGRFMLYDEMDPEDEKKVDQNWLRGHSDSGGFTFITSQPILSLQIRDYYTGKWRYVGHKPNSLIVNVGDAMEFITGSYFKLLIHRVVAPPNDQRSWKRLVLIYFSAPKSTSVIDPEPLNSPKLKRLGYNKPPEWHKITYAAWQNEKGRLFGQKKVNDSKGDEPNLVLMYGRLHERWHQAEGDFSLEEARKRFEVIELEAGGK